MNASGQLEMTVLLSRVVADRLWPLASFRNQPRSKFWMAAFRQSVASTGWNGNPKRTRWDLLQSHDPTPMTWRNCESWLVQLRVRKWPVSTDWST